MVKKTVFSQLKGLRLGLVILLIMTMIACQTTSSSSSLEQEYLMPTQAEVQAYMASVKHYFNPH